MNPYFRNYYWKNGSPKGWQKVSNDELVSDETYYKIITDPYFKHISVEKYFGQTYDSTPYDSLLMDFRRLNEMQQLAWQRIILSESENEIVSLLKDQNDRVVYKEVHFIEKGLCRQCEVFTPQGFLVSCHKMHYEHLQDSFNGVTLFDRLSKPVIKKVYEIDESKTAYKDLIEETKDFTPFQTV